MNTSIRLNKAIKNWFYGVHIGWHKLDEDDRDMYVEFFSFLQLLTDPDSHDAS